MKKRFMGMVLTLAMSLVLCVPAFAAEGKIPTDSAIDTRIMCATENVGLSESGITRDANPPRQYYDLSQGTYSVDGTFEVSIYSARYFKPNAAGKINYSVVLTWQEAFEVYPILPTMTVECWDRTENERVTQVTFESTTNVWPFTPVIFSNSRVISGLNPDHEYYFVFRKDITGALARITGTISH